MHLESQSKTPKIPTWQIAYSMAQWLLDQNTVSDHEFESFRVNDCF